MSISQQLVRKMLKAHTFTSKEDAEKASSNKSLNRKRKKDAVGRGPNDRVATEEDIAKFHAKMLQITDRAMATSLDMKNKSSKSNAAAYHTLVQRQQQTLNTIEQQKTLAAQAQPGAARSSASTLSQPLLVKIPSFNKERYEKELKEKRRMKLAKALEKFQKEDIKKKEAKEAKNNFWMIPGISIFDCG